MKKLKLFLLLFLATLCAGNFAACKDDDSQESSKNTASIVGTWQCSAEFETITVTFMPNGRFTESWSGPGYSGSDSGSYTYDGTTLALIYDDGTRESYSGVVVSGNQLMFDGIVYIRM